MGCIIHIPQNGISGFIGPTLLFQSPLLSSFDGSLKQKATATFSFGLKPNSNVQAFQSYGLVNLKPTDSVQKLHVGFGLSLTKPICFLLSPRMNFPCDVLALVMLSC